MDFDYPYNLLILISILFLELVSAYFFLRCTLIDPGIVLIPIQNIEPTGDFLLKIKEVSYFFFHRNQFKDHRLQKQDVCVEILLVM